MPSRGVFRQPDLALLLAGCAAAIAPLAIHLSGRPTSLQWLLAAALGLGTVVSFRFPVHVAAHIKLCLAAPALLILSVSVPPFLALVVSMLAACAGNLSIRRRTGLLPVDIVSEALRWGLAVSISAVIMHGMPQSWQPGPLVLATLVLYGVDVLTVTAMVATLDSRSYRSILSDALDNWRFEVALYLTGALGAIDAARQPWSLVLLAVPSALVYKAVQNSYELGDHTRRLIDGLADTVDARDAYLNGHSQRVAGYARVIVEALQRQGVVGPLEADLIVAAAKVHDVGKIEVPDTILTKRAALTDDERRIVELHVERGAEILRCYPNFRLGVPLVRHHHERWDGEGYPSRLSRHDIPLGSRVIAVADSFDAMTSARVQGPGMSRERAARILRRGRGTQWDPHIVDALIDALNLSSMDHLRLVEDGDERSGSESA